jgi:hypothetical protein
MLSVNLVYQLNYAFMYKSLLDLKGLLADLGVNLLVNESSRGDIPIVQSHLFRDLRKIGDARISGPVIIHERADQDTVRPTNRDLIKDPYTIAWLKDYTIRDTSLHNAPHVQGYYHFCFFTRDETKYPAVKPESILDESDFRKIHLPFCVPSYARFDDLRLRPSLPPSQRNIDAFMFGGITSSWELYQRHRFDACRAMAGLAAHNRNYQVLLSAGRLLQRSELCELLGRSKIVVSHYGHSMTSHRDWDVLYAGCVLIHPDCSQQVNYLPDVFKDNAWYVPCAVDYSDLEEKVDLVLSNYQEFYDRAQVARAALMESGDLERRASDFYYFLMEALEREPAPSVQRYAPIEPGSFRPVMREPPRRGPNLFDGSTDLSDPAWLKVRSTLMLQQCNGPGGIAGWKLVEDESGMTHDVRRSLVKARITRPYSLSFVAKPAERSHLRAWILGDKHRDRSEIAVDLTRGEVYDMRAVGEGWPTPVAGIVSLADGWSWCWMSVHSDESDRIAVLVMLTTAGGGDNYKGDGRSGLWLGGFRLEVGTVPTLVLPREATTKAGSLSEDFEKYFRHGPSGFGLGFHGDYYLLSIIYNAVRQASVFVETGAAGGTSTSQIGRAFPWIRCYSCELDEGCFASALRYVLPYPNVTIENVASPLFLRQLTERMPELLKAKAVFWLDAHGNDVACPLADEVKFITSNFAEAAIFIDDFEVPGRPEFGFDRYPKGPALTWGYVAPSLAPNRVYTIVRPRYQWKTSLHAPLRGWILIAFGEWQVLPAELGIYYEVSRFSVGGDLGTVAVGRPDPKPVFLATANGQ